MMFSRYFDCDGSGERICDDSKLLKIMADLGYKPPLDFAGV